MAKMKKLLALLPIALILGSFTFASDYERDYDDDHYENQYEHRYEYYDREDDDDRYEHRYEYNREYSGERYRDDDRYEQRYEYRQEARMMSGDMSGTANSMRNEYRYQYKYIKGTVKDKVDGIIKTKLFDRISSLPVDQQETVLNRVLDKVNTMLAELDAKTTLTTRDEIKKEVLEYLKEQIENYMTELTGTTTAEDVVNEVLQ